MAVQNYFLLLFNAILTSRQLFTIPVITFYLAQKDLEKRATNVRQTLALI